MNKLVETERRREKKRDEERRETKRDEERRRETKRDEERRRETKREEERYHWFYSQELVHLICPLFNHLYVLYVDNMRRVGVRGKEGRGGRGDEEEEIREGGEMRKEERDRETYPF